MSADRCPAETPFHIGNQTPTILHCYADAGDDGPHRAMTLDSDDNPIIEQWYADEALGGTGC